MFPSLLNLTKHAFLKYHVCVILSRLCDTSHTGQKPAKALLYYQFEISLKSKNIFIRLVKIKSLGLAESWSPKWDFTPTTTHTFRPVLGMTGCSSISCRVFGCRLHDILVKVVFSLFHEPRAHLQVDHLSVCGFSPVCYWKSLLLVGFSRLLIGWHSITVKGFGWQH